MNETEVTAEHQGTVPLPPDKDAKRLVERIIEQAHLGRPYDRITLEIRLGVIQGDAERLKALLEERDVAAGDMLIALERIRLRVEPGRSHGWTLDEACREVGWVDDECRRALAAARGGAA